MWEEVITDHNLLHTGADHLATSTGALSQKKWPPHSPRPKAVLPSEKQQGREEGIEEWFTAVELEKGERVLVVTEAEVEKFGAQLWWHQPRR